MEGYFDLSKWVRDFMRLWFIFTGSTGALCATAFVLDLITKSHYAGANAGLVFIAIALMLLLGFLVPKAGSLLAQGEDTFLLEFLQQTLAARLEPRSDP